MYVVAGWRGMPPWVGEYGVHLLEERDPAARDPYFRSEATFSARHPGSFEGGVRGGAHQGSSKRVTTDCLLQFLLPASRAHSSADTFMANPPPLQVLTIDEAVVAMLVNRHVPPDRRATEVPAAKLADGLPYSILSAPSAARPSRVLWPERTPRCGFPDSLPKRR